MTQPDNQTAVGLPAPGRRNLISDVEGLRVGNAADAALRSGVTVVLPDQPAVASIDVRGGGPGTRESDPLAPAATVREIHGLVLSGGSAFGLSAASGVQNWLLQHGIGYRVGPPAGAAVVPIVPQAILFDLLNGGDKDWGERAPYEALARAACDAAGKDFELGTAGAGYGATTANLKGGLGSASLVTAEGYTLGALVAVNALGQVTIGGGAHFWAAPFECGSEYGALGLPKPWPNDATDIRLKGAPGSNAISDAADGAATTCSELPQNTTIAIIATDAMLSKAQCQRLAVMAQTGLARAIYPVHCPLDGDVVFALSTGRKALADDPASLGRLGALAANSIARAIARGIHEASSLPGSTPPSWRERFG